MTLEMLVWVDLQPLSLAIAFCFDIYATNLYSRGSLVQHITGETITSIMR